MAPEHEARKKIDELLTAAGWIVQDYKQRNLGASIGVAVREFQLGQDAADYLLFIDRLPVGVVEAKSVGITLSGVSEQSEKYLRLIPKYLPNLEKLPPFHYESTGVETFFRDLRDPNSRSRRLFAFHKPETLRDWFDEQDTLRARLQKLPPLTKGGLWDCQYVAINNLEKSFAQSRPRALIQMATGSGKTFTAVSFVYRLIKFAGAKRVPFLVDRNNLGRQTKREFENYVTPDDGRKFTQIYNIQHLQSNAIDEPSKGAI